MENNADLAMVQKTIIDTLHKEGKSQRVITESGGYSRSAASKHIKCKVDWKEEATETEPILAIRRIRKLRRAPETPGPPPPCSQRGFHFILVLFFNLASGYEDMNDHLL